MIYDCLTLSIKQDTANKPYAAVLHDTIRCDEQFVKLLMKKVLLLKNTHFWKLRLFKC